MATNPFDTITIDPTDQKRIRKEAEDFYLARYKSAISSQIEEAFKSAIIRDGKVYREEGPMLAIVRKQVEDFFLDEKCQKRINTYLEEALQKALEQTIQRVVNHIAGRDHFNDLVKRGQETLEKVLSDPETFVDKKQD